MKDKNYPGKGCKCGAYGEYECGCPNVDWSPAELRHLREKVFMLEKQIAESTKKIERQADRVRYLEGATNHATGTPLSKMREQRDECERQFQAKIEELIAVTEQRDRLENALRIMVAEYEVMKSQFGCHEIWKKFEDVESIKQAYSELRPL